MDSVLARLAENAKPNGLEGRKLSQFGNLKILVFLPKSIFS
jgi:hypothetical protein